MFSLHCNSIQYTSANCTSESNLILSLLLFVLYINYCISYAYSVQFIHVQQCIQISTRINSSMYICTSFVCSTLRSATVCWLIIQQQPWTKWPQLQIQHRLWHGKRMIFPVPMWMVLYFNIFFITNLHSISSHIQPFPFKLLIVLAFTCIYILRHQLLSDVIPHYNSQVVILFQYRSKFPVIKTLGNMCNETTVKWIL